MGLTQARPNLIWLLTTFTCLLHCAREPSIGVASKNAILKFSRTLSKLTSWNLCSEGSVLPCGTSLLIEEHAIRRSHGMIGVPGDKAKYYLSDTMGVKHRTLIIDAVFIIGVVTSIIALIGHGEYE